MAHMWVTARAVCGRVLSPPVWSPRFPGSLPYVEQPQSTSTDTRLDQTPRTAVYFWQLSLSDGHCADERLQSAND